MHNRKAGDALAWPCCSRPAAKYVEPDRFGKKQSTGPGSPKKSNTIARNASRGHFLSESFVPSKWYDCPSSLRKSLCEKQQLVPLWFLQYPCKGNMTARPSALKRRTFGKIRQASQPPRHSVAARALRPPEPNAIRSRRANGEGFNRRFAASRLHCHRRPLTCLIHRILGDRKR